MTAPITKPDGTVIGGAPVPATDANLDLAFTANQTVTALPGHIDIDMTGAGGALTLNFDLQGAAEAPPGYEVSLFRSDAVAQTLTVQEGGQAIAGGVFPGGGGVDSIVLKKVANNTPGTADGWRCLGRTTVT